MCYTLMRSIERMQSAGRMEGGAQLYCKPQEANIVGLNEQRPKGERKSHRHLDLRGAL